MSQKQFQSTTQKFLDIHDITNNLVILKDGTVSFVLTISAMNFGLLAEAEQDAIIYTYAALLNSLNYPIQIIIQSQTKDATSYLNLLKDQENKASTEQKKERIARYRGFVGNLIKERNVLDKKFYVVVPATPVELGLMTADSVIPGRTDFDASKYEKSLILEKAEVVLEPKRDHLISQFARIGLYARQLTTQEIIRIFYTNYNPEATEGQEIADTTHYTTPLVRANLMKQAQQMASQGQETPAQQTAEGFSAPTAGAGSRFKTTRTETEVGGGMQDKSADVDPSEIPEENLDLNLEQEQDLGEEQDLDDAQTQSQTQDRPQDQVQDQTLPSKPTPSQTQSQNYDHRDDSRAAAVHKSTPVQSNMPGGKKSPSQTGAQKQPSLTESETEIGINEVGRKGLENSNRPQNPDQQKTEQQNPEKSPERVPEPKPAERSQPNEKPGSKNSFKIEESIDDFSYAPPKSDANSDLNSTPGQNSSSNSLSSPASKPPAGTQPPNTQIDSNPNTQTDSGPNSQTQNLKKNAEGEAGANKNNERQKNENTPPPADNQQAEINNLIKKVSVFPENGKGGGSGPKTKQTGAGDQGEGVNGSSGMPPIPEIK